MGSDWMRDLPIELTRIPLCNLAIPGSHDSGATDDLSTVYPIANDECDNKWLNCFGKRQNFRKIVRRWAITQHHTPREQCELGVRYFDLRVSNPPPTGPSQFRLVHALYGPKVVDFLVEIREFLVEHPKEVIILDMNHLFDVDDTVHEQLEKEVVGVFGEDRVCGHSQALSVTLENLWLAGKQLVVLTSLDGYPSGQLLWPKQCIRAPYPETNNIKELINYLQINQAQCRPQCPLAFYVTQGVCTATMRDITAHPFSSLEKELSLKTSATVVKWLADYAFPELINIVIIDFIDPHYCDTVVQINVKKLEKMQRVCVESLQA